MHEYTYILSAHHLHFFIVNLSINVRRTERWVGGCALHPQFRSRERWRHWWSAKWEGMIRSYPGKSMIISEFESSIGTTRINQRRTRNKTEMEDATI